MSSAAARLRLRPPQMDDEAAFADAQRAMDADGFTFGHRFDEAPSWPAYLEGLEAQRRGIDVPGSFVPCTFLVADVDGQVVGRTSIRHELNEFLAREGGHIGYCVLPRHRRRGYATEILRQSLVVARAVGVDRVLVTCDDDNVASATVIERCGGMLESVVPNESAGGAGGPPLRRYWID